MVRIRVFVFFIYGALSARPPGVWVRVSSSLSLLVLSFGLQGVSRAVAFEGTTFLITCAADGWPERRIFGPIAFSLPAMLSCVPWHAGCLTKQCHSTL